MTDFGLYCLGYTHTKCETCQYSGNWLTLNQMPDALRKPIQTEMLRVDSDRCRMSNMGTYEKADK